MRIQADGKSRLVALKYAEALLAADEISLLWDILLLSGDRWDSVSKYNSDVITAMVAGYYDRYLNPSSFSLKTAL